MGNLAKDQLHGWKEIAAYLGRDERTAKRWEKQRGLPVRRIPGAGRANVYILISELEAWLSAAPPPTQVEASHQTEPPDTHEPTAQQTGSSASEAYPPPQIDPKVMTAPADFSAPGLTPSRGYFRAALVLVLAGGAAWAAWRAHRPKENKQASAASPVLGHRPSGSLRAEIDEQYLQSLYFLEQRTPESLEEAKRDLLEVIAHDPAHAPAFAQLANTYLMLREFASVPDEEAYNQAQRAASQAILLDPHLPEAHASLGYIAFFSARSPGSAESHFLEALRLDPTCALAQFWYGSLLTHQGRYREALNHLNRAQQLQPTSSAIQASRAYALGLSGQRDEAVRLLQALLKMDPNAPAAHRTLARLSLMQPRDVPQYLAETQRFAELKRDTRQQHLVVLARQSFRRGGEQAMWGAILASEQTAETSSGEPSYLMAESETQLGQIEPALRHLERLGAKHDSRMMNLVIDPLFEPLRSNPRFRQIVILVGLRAPAEPFGSAPTS